MADEPRGRKAPISHQEDCMSNKVWRPLNSYGIYFLGVTIGFTMIYALLELARANSVL